MTPAEQRIEDLANNILLWGQREVDRLSTLKERPRLKMVRMIGEDWLERVLSRAAELRGEAHLISDDSEVIL
jgi:hypothetical protein